MPAPPNMQPKPPAVFPGERGFMLLECVVPELRNRGKTTGCRYTFAEGWRRYVDVRDMSGMDKTVLTKVDDATQHEADRPQETSELDGDS